MRGRGLGGTAEAAGGAPAEGAAEERAGGGRRGGPAGLGRLVHPQVQGPRRGRGRAGRGRGHGRQPEQSTCNEAVEKARGTLRSPPVHCGTYGQRGSEDCGDRTVRTAWGTEWLRAKCLTTWSWRAWWFCADRQGPCGGGGRCGPSGRRGDGAVSPAVSQVHQLDHTVSHTEPSVP